MIEGGTYDTVIFTPAGPNSGTIDLDGKLIAYSGLEPVLLNAGTADDIIYNLTSGDDEAVIVATPDF